MSQNPYEAPNSQPGKLPDPLREDELVTLVTYWSATEAHAAKGALEAAGIKAMLSGEHLANMNWGLINATGGVKLHVLRRDFSAAAEVLELADDAAAERMAADEDEVSPAAIGEPQFIDEADEVSEPDSDSDEFAKRAFFAAIFSLLFPPIILVSLYLAIYVCLYTRQPLSTQGWLYFSAAVVGIAFFGLVALAFWARLTSLMQPPIPY